MRQIVKLPYQFVAYVFFAGIATLVDMGVLYSSTELIGISYLYSALLGYGCGMITNFSLNKWLTFKNQSQRYALQASMFLIVALVGLAINQFIIFLLVEFVEIWYMYAKIVAVVLVSVWSFTGHNLLTFGRMTD